MSTMTAAAPRKFLELTRIREAAGVSVDKAARTARVVIITEGLGNLRDKNYYTADAIASAVKTFEGKQFYLDHPSESEESDRPERSMRDLAGYFSDCQAGTVNDLETGEALAACFATLHFSEGDAGNLAFGQVQTAIEYQRRYPGTKDVYCGISINGGGISHPGTIEDMVVNMVTEIQEAFSADVVTKPARGGKFLALMAEADKTSALKRRWANQSRRTAQEGQGRVVMATVVKEETAARPRAAGSTREAEGDENGNGNGGENDAERERMKTAAGARSRMLRVATGLRAKLKTAAGEGMDAKTILADIQSDMDMLGAALDAMGDGGEEPVAGEGEGAMLTSAAAESTRDGKGKGATTLETTKTETRTTDRTNGGDRPAGRRPGLAAAREAEDETRREGEGQAEGEGRREGEGGEARAGEGEGRREGEDEGRREGEGDAEGYGMSAGEHDDGQLPPGDGSAGPGDGQLPGQRMQYQCAHCGEKNVVAPPRGMQMVASESNRTDADALRLDRDRLKKRLESQEGRFLISNREKSTLIKENISLRAENQANKRMAEAVKLLKEANVPRDILSPGELVLIENQAEWPVHIKTAQRMLAREGHLVNRGGNRSRDGGAGGGAEKGAEGAITKFDESYKKATN